MKYGPGGEIKRPGFMSKPQRLEAARLAKLNSGRVELVPFPVIFLFGGSALGKAHANENAGEGARATPSPTKRLGQECPSLFLPIANNQKPTAAFNTSASWDPPDPPRLEFRRRDCGLS
jgi:hypothetical protein